jgi:transposase
MWQTAIEVRRDVTPTVLRKKARQEKDGRVASRLLALANVLEGMDRETAARQAGMTRQTLRDWVHRYNADGLKGLRDQPKGRPRRALTPEQEQELETLVLQGPDGDRVRWRCVDLKRVIEERFQVVCHERTVGKILRRLDFSRLSVRPIHHKSDPEAQQAFKKTSPPWSTASCPNTPAAGRSSSGSRTRHGSARKEP